MGIPANQLITAEIIVSGRMLTGGGGSLPPSINVFHFRRTAVINNVSKAALNTIFQTTIIVPLLAAMNARYTPGSLTIRMIEDATDFPTPFSVAGAGAIATDGAPSDTAVYYLLRTLTRGKSYRGSKHFGPLSEVDTTNDILTGAGLARWQTLQTALAASMTDATPNTWVPVVLSRKLSQLKTNPTTVTTTDVSSVLLDLNVGTMRRRRSKTVR